MRQWSFSGARYDDLGRVEITTDPGTTRLALAEVKMLYALAESDWGWLTDRDLAGRGLMNQPEAVQSLANLAGLGLVTPGGAPSDRQESVTQITDLGLQLITWLSRDWANWPEYSRRFGLDQY